MANRRSRALRLAIITALVLGLMGWASGVEAVPWAQEPLVHVVRPGENLFRIALRYGLTVEELARANGIADPNLIFVGQRLVIPSPLRLSLVYRPGRGDSLAFVALRYGLNPWRLARANGLNSPYRPLLVRRLTVPLAVASPPLPFLAWDFHPNPSLQGQTLVIKLRMPAEVALSGRFDGQPLDFYGDGDWRWALVGIPITAPVGRHAIELWAEEGGGRGVEVVVPISVGKREFPMESIRLSPRVARLLEPGLIKAENERLARLTEETTPHKMWEGVWGLPVQGKITSVFGARRSYNGGPFVSHHTGVDFKAPEGTPVFAPAGGRVVLAEELAVRGKAVVLDHGLGVYSGYWHLSGIAVQAGEEVTRGQLLGWVGNTGLSTGPHLHWEVKVKGVHVDPLQWIREDIPSL